MIRSGVIAMVSLDIAFPFVASLTADRQPHVGIIASQPRSLAMV